MKKYTLSLFLAFLFLQSKAQEIKENGFNRIGEDGSFNTQKTRKKEKPLEVVYTDYKIISYENDTTFIDTTLNISKHYKFNYLRKDNFEELEFSNTGQPSNHLGYNFETPYLFPKMGATEKHTIYSEKKDITYYHLPTPSSEIMYKITPNKGQFLDVFFTANISKQFNLFIANKGLNAPGDYNNSFVNNINFDLGFSFQNKKENYFLRGHRSAQTLTRNENGGLTPIAINSFTDDNPDFYNRERLSVNLTEAYSVLKGKRYFLEQRVKLNSTKKDSISNKKIKVELGHQIVLENKFYLFNQERSTTNFFGNSYSTKIRDSVHNRMTTNTFFLEITDNNTFGYLKIKADYIDYTHHYKSVIFNSEGIAIPSGISGQTISMGAEWKKKINNFNFKTEAASFLSGNLKGHYLSIKTDYKKDSLYALYTTLSTNSRPANFNFLILQSDYLDYNWYNKFDNNIINNINLGASSIWGNLNANISQIQNYTFFNQSMKPEQYNNNLIYFKGKIDKEFSLGNFFLDNSILYQKVFRGAEIFKVPSFLTRNTLYYSNRIFKGKPMLLQSGVSFKYFSSFVANEFNPLLNEFVLQNTTVIGAYPLVDLFAEAKIQTMRIYLKLENATASNFLSNLFERNYFASPTQPYKDATIRFGVVWNWFQ